MAIIVVILGVIVISLAFFGKELASAEKGQNTSGTPPQNNNTVSQEVQTPEIDVEQIVTTQE